MPVAVVADPVEVLYDSGRVPLWLRVPCLLLALLCLASLSDLVALKVAGRTVLLPPPTDLPAGWLVAVVGTGVLALFLLQVWVGRKRILWDTERRELRLEDRWLFGTSRMTIARADLAAVRVRLGQLKASTFWDLSVRDRTGRMTWLTRAATEADGRALGGRIAAAIDRPLESA